MAKVKDGWHTVGRYDVWVENGRVQRAVKKTFGDDGSGTLYPYRWMGHPYNGLVNTTGITLSALRSGLRHGTIVLR